MLEPHPLNRFEFNITLNYGGDPESIRLPHKFADVVDVRKNQVLLRMRGGATGLWTTQVLFDHTGTLFPTTIETH
jgi:hypothetical protein